MYDNIINNNDYCDKNLGNNHNSYDEIDNNNMKNIIYHLQAFYEEQMFDIKEEKKLLEMELAELKKKITSTRETSASNRST